MAERVWACIDGNEAVARIAHRLSDICSIYPITPASAMGELADAYSAAGRPNLWGAVPEVVELQSEAGAAGALHGAVTTGALGTTFTASQGLLLMLPVMYKLAGELTPAVIHVAARAIATHALSIFGDHSDVMSARGTGWTLLSSSGVQEAQDLALVAHAAALRSRIPVLHFFDGFRTSHEVDKISLLDDDDLRALISDEDVAAHRARGLTPEHPQVRGTAQNPDVFFQGREAANRYYDEVPAIVADLMARLGERTGRRYGLVDYYGDPAADRVIVLMGSAAGAVRETVDVLRAKGERVGVAVVRLYRPFPSSALVAALPATVERIAVLDRSKEPGAPAEPLHLDVSMALLDRGGELPMIVGGRYGLGSKEFTPAMAAAIFADLASSAPRRSFTVGIDDDVTGLSLPVDRRFQVPTSAVQALFYGLGSDGTVGANKTTIKLIGEHTDKWAQGYFVYDSRKSGAVTVSHLRFGPEPIQSTYLIDNADFVACHQFNLLERLPVLGAARVGATLLLNAPYPANEVWDHLPVGVRSEIVAKRISVWTVDAHKVAKEVGLGSRINTVMQPCFFALSKVLPVDEAIALIKESITATYAKRGASIVSRNHEAVDRALAALSVVEVPATFDAPVASEADVLDTAPAFVREVIVPLLRDTGDLLPVSALPADGAFPSGTARYEKRAIAIDIPVWDPDLCIDCGKCVLACPHSAIRMKVFPAELLVGAPDQFPSKDYASRDLPPGTQLTVQVAPDDCTGCGICVDVCPARSKSEVRHKSLNLEPARSARDRERPRYEFFLEIPEVDRAAVRHDTVKGSQLLQPLFEFSGACSGCGETPYLSLLTRLFGDRLLIANATGCSSIYGANLPTTPWTTDASGRGPAWSNSLFEDNAEFGLGMRLAVDHKFAVAQALLAELAPGLSESVVAALTAPPRTDEDDVLARRAAVAALTEELAGLPDDAARQLALHAADLQPPNVWIVGGDGWAYDIGFGGLDHVLASGRNVNILVLDTEVYSNTGGQASKATQRGAAAKFATSGKGTMKKDLGLLAQAYGDVYVAQIAIGASETQTVRALLEAAAWPGPSLVIAYSTCIAHGIEMATSMTHQKAAVASGYWPLYRVHPSPEPGTHPVSLDSKAPSVPVGEFMAGETRFSMLAASDPVRAAHLEHLAQSDVDQRWKYLTQLAGLDLRSPIVASPSPLTSELATLVRLDDSGVGAVVLPSLFEEDVEVEAWNLHDRFEAGVGLTAEAANFLPDLDLGHLLVDRHLRLVEHAVDRLGVPVVASLNGTSAGGWVHYAERLVAAGAAAIELNMYDIATDSSRPAAAVESGYLALVRAVRSAVDVPIAVKVGPFFTSFGHFAAELVAAGADGLVLFNRFYQPDLDVETRDVTPRITLSTPAELRLPLRWIALLHPRLPGTSLALTSGAHTGEDVVKGLLAGADVVMTTSALLREGPEHVAVLTNGLRTYLADHGYDSVDQLRGSVAHDAASDPAGYERVQYQRVLSSWPTGNRHH